MKIIRLISGGWSIAIKSFGMEISLKRVGYLGIDAGGSNTRTDVMAFVLDELKNAKYVRQLPLISN